MCHQCEEINGDFVETTHALCKQGIPSELTWLSSFPQPKRNSSASTGSHYHGHEPIHTGGLIYISDL